MSAEHAEARAMILETAAHVFANHSGSAAVRRAIEHMAGRDEALWHRLAREQGWCGLAVPETAGGAGLGAQEMVVLMEQMGRHLACVPYFSTACLAGTALARCGSDAAQAWLARIAAGEMGATLVGSNAVCPDATGIAMRAEQTTQGYRLWGAGHQVFDGACAELLIVPASMASESQTVALFAIEAGAPGLIRRPLATLDATRPLAYIELNGLDVSHTALLAAGHEAECAVSCASWFGALAMAAEQLGGAQACLDLTLAYTADRMQFGRAIGSFQAVKHRCAQMLVELEATRSAVLGAAQAWDADDRHDALPTHVLLDVATAKATANEAFRFCAQEAIQLHGGVGFTWDYDPQLYFKRAQASSAQFGTTVQLLSWIAAQVIDCEEPHA